jgi:hypothetical protein
MQVHYSISSSATGVTLTKVQEPSPCYFEFHVTGPSNREL